jgi:hypothetical protein
LSWTWKPKIWTIETPQLTLCRNCLSAHKPHFVKRRPSETREWLRANEAILARFDYYDSEGFTTSLLADACGSKSQTSQEQKDPRLIAPRNLVRVRKLRQRVRGNRGHASYIYMEPVARLQEYRKRANQSQAQKLEVQLPQLLNESTLFVKTLFTSLFSIAIGPKSGKQGGKAGDL